MNDYSWYGNPNRLVCYCLDEMRKILKHNNLFTYNRNTLVLSSLIEEIQVYVNRMESGLEDGHDLRKLRKVIKEETAKLKKLNRKRKKLEGEKNEK